MSVEEGRAAASLARASRALSACLIYIHETIKGCCCQELFKHFYQVLFFDWISDCRAPTPVW